MDVDRQQLLDGLEDTVVRCGWELLSFVFMPTNHIHLFFRTPQPNLSRGMQRLLSSYAYRFARRHRRPGHLFQCRLKGELIEDEGYFRSVIRYIHLNSVRGKRPLSSHPRDWLWSSNTGYGDKRKRLPWVSYDLVLAAWQSGAGGSSPVASYRHNIEQVRTGRLRIHWPKLHTVRSLVARISLTAFAGKCNRRSLLTKCLELERLEP